jgi:hypothetical protein
MGWSEKPGDAQPGNEQDLYFPKQFFISMALTMVMPAMHGIHQKWMPPCMAESIMPLMENLRLLMIKEISPVNSKQRSFPASRNCKAVE